MWQSHGSHTIPFFPWRKRCTKRRKKIVFVRLYEVVVTVNVKRLKKIKKTHIPFLVIFIVLWHYVFCFWPLHMKLTLYYTVFSHLRYWEKADQCPAVILLTGILLDYAKEEESVWEMSFKFNIIYVAYHIYYTLFSKPNHQRIVKSRTVSWFSHICWLNLEEYISNLSWRIIFSQSIILYIKGLSYSSVLCCIFLNSVVYISHCLLLHSKIDSASEVNLCIEWKGNELKWSV